MIDEQGSKRIGGEEINWAIHQVAGILQVRGCLVFELGFRIVNRAFPGKTIVFYTD